jgi:hypothetical protein
MPKTLHGTGGTGREQVLDLAMDAFTRGHSVPLGGHFKPSNNRQMTGVHVESTLNHRRSGNRLIVCGDSKMGSNHVCGS